MAIASRLEGSGVEAMLIAGVVMILFILGLFFEMLGSRPRTEAEWQNDTEREPASTPAQSEVHVPVTHA
jgi:hypothetical protein